MRALIKECKLLGVALNPITVNTMILDVLAMIVWFITSWSLHRIFATDHLLRPWRVRSLCKMWGVCLCFQALYISPPLKCQEMKKFDAHLTALCGKLDGSTTTWVWMMAISRVLHGRGITWRVVYHQVIKKLVAELDRSVVFVRTSGFLPRGCCWQTGWIWMEGVSLQKSRLERRCLPRQCGSWMNWLIHRTIFETQRLDLFSWNMLRNV